MTRQIAARVRQNHACLVRLVRNHPAADLVPAEGGWYAVMRVPATDSEERLTLDLLERAHVLVYPGYFFDFQKDAFLVISLLPEPYLFESAARRVLSFSAGSESAPL